MNKEFKYILTICLVSPWILFADQGDKILGDWITAGGQSRVKIFKKDDLYFGRLVALKEPYYLPNEDIGVAGTPRLDVNNPDKSLSSRPMIGIELMSNFHFDDGKWVGGRIYDPQNGKSYKCNISLAEDGNLHVRGFVGISLLGRTTVWETAKSYLEKELAFLGINNCTCQSSDETSNKE